MIRVGELVHLRGRDGRCRRCRVVRVDGTRLGSPQVYLDVPGRAGLLSIAESQLRASDRATVQGALF